MLEDARAYSLRAYSARPPGWFSSSCPPAAPARGNAAQFLRIEHVEQHHIVAVQAQRLEGLHHGGRLGVENRKAPLQARPVQEVLKVDERLAEIRARPGFRLLDGVQQTE